MAWWIFVGIGISGLVILAVRVSFFAGLVMLFLEHVLIGWAFWCCGVGLSGGVSEVRGSCWVLGLAFSGSLVVGWVSGGGRLCSLRCTC